MREASKLKRERRGTREAEMEKGGEWRFGHEKKYKPIQTDDESTCAIPSHCEQSNRMEWNGEEREGIVRFRSRL